VKTVETPNFTLRLGDDGVARISFAASTEIGLDMARECVAALEQLTGGRPCPLLVDLGNVRTVNQEARAYFASSQAVTARAMLADSAFSAALGNFFMRVNRPAGPTRLFTSEADAGQWLKGFLP
jgi:hypothetical protein